jgi:hypothetical protein
MPDPKAGTLWIAASTKRLGEQKPEGPQSESTWQALPSTQ